MSRSFFHFSAGLALSMLLQGCGGGGSDPAPVASVASVRLEGCVVDQFFVPNQGVPVRVLSADGRTLAYTTSGRMGEFTVQLPAGVPTAVAVDRADGEWMPTPALDRDRVVESCLIARN
jgi:hypothetical protein